MSFHWTIRSAFLAFSLAATLTLAPGTMTTVRADEAPSSVWFGSGERGDTQVDVYFFWSLTCPHCHRAAAYLVELEKELPWLRIHAHEITQTPANAAFFDALARAVGKEARSVPAIFICGQLITGFDEAATTGAAIQNLSRDCREYGTQVLSGESPEAVPTPAEDTAQIPFLGTVSLQAYSLPILTIVLAGLDAFNPCAFFVLLFLLSLLIHVHSRTRMAVIGGVFVLFSGIIYFLFITAWLNLFMVIGHLEIVTLAAGLIAVGVGLLNVKDFFWFRAGFSLGISETAKPKLFDRMRGLVQASSLPVMLVGTVALAVAANSYELLCTAGFPMVFTRALTMQGLTPTTYYLYLALYNMIYVIPLAVIVALFTVTLGARKLTERQGRVLKLVSGLMMLGLGTVLLVAPELMANVFVAVGLVTFALAATAAAMWLERLIGKRPKAVR